jgi:hypothetical protein
MPLRRLCLLAAALFASIALLAGAAEAQRPPPPAPHETFEATVTHVGTAPGFLCGGMAALQEVDVRVTRVSSGHFHAGDTPKLSVLTCFGGPLLRPIAGAGAPVFELDPALVKPGAHIAFDVDPGARAGTGWIVTTEMRVLP